MMKGMNRPEPTLFALQQTIIDFARIDRNIYLAKTERRENDVEHSFCVALLCWFIHDKYKLKLDVTKILKYALVHDLVEVYAGDVNTYASPEARQRKVDDEHAALERLTTEYGEFPDMTNTMAAYEAKEDEESLFVWTVDKMQQLVMGGMDGWRPFAEYGVDYQRFVDKCQEQIGKASPYCKQILEALVAYSRTTYYDRPPKS